MPQKFVNLENLTSFWGNAKEYIGNERKEIENQLYNWQKTEKASIVQCEPVPNSELYPTIEFKFKETLPEGDKGPDNPSTITGISSVGMGLYGKNLLCPPYISGDINNSDITITSQLDGSLVITSSTYTGNRYYILNAIPVMFKAGTNIIMSIKYDGGTVSYNSIALQIIDAQTNTILKWQYQYNESSVYTLDHDAFLKFRLYIASTHVCENLVVKPMVEIGVNATEYEKGSCVNNIIPFGNTYYGGSIDLTTGLMMVVWEGKELVVSPEKNYTWRSSAEYLEEGVYRYQLSILTGATGIGSCSHLPHGTYTSPLWSSYPRNNGRFVMILPYATVEEADAWIQSEYEAGHPVTIVYEMSTPTIVQLTPQQIKSLSSLEGTSKRINIIYTDADSVQVEYQKYVGIDSTLDSNSVNAIQNKTVNSALNTKVSLSGDETINGIKTFSNIINGSITGNAGTVAGHIVSKDVPVNAAFTDTTYNSATQSTAGLMSASDKAKLDAVGSVFSFKGSVVDDTYLPVSDNVNGDAYLAEDTGHVHVYDGSSFVDIGIWAGIPSATDAQIDALFED